VSAGCPSNHCTQARELQPAQDGSCISGRRRHAFTMLVLSNPPASSDSQRPREPHLAAECLPQQPNEEARLYCCRPPSVRPRRALSAACRLLLHAPVIPLRSANTRFDAQFILPSNLTSQRPVAAPLCLALLPALFSCCLGCPCVEPCGGTRRRESAPEHSARTIRSTRRPALRTRARSTPCACPCFNRSPPSYLTRISHPFRSLRHGAQAGRGELETPWPMAAFSTVSTARRHCPCFL
jgi:hypothetical protein